MIDRTIVKLTIRQLLGQKRTILMAFFALIPVAIACLVRIAASEGDDLQDIAANSVLGGLIVKLLLPLTALIFGTAALGAEFEDGTAVYLLSKPIPRATVVISKLLVCWLATVAVVLLATLAAGAIVLAGEPQAGIIPGFTAGVILGSLAYCAGFLWLSIATSRALIVGLLYVFIWEGAVANLFSGVHMLSIGAYTTGIAGWFVDLRPRIFDPDLDAGISLLLTLAVAAVATWFGVRALKRWEIGEAS